MYVVAYCLSLFLPGKVNRFFLNKENLKRIHVQLLYAVPLFEVQVQDIKVCSEAPPSECRDGRQGGGCQGGTPETGILGDQPGQM